MSAVEGTRGNGVTTALSDNYANYATMGLTDSVTLEAIAAGRNFQDAKATATTNLLLRCMTQEEIQILFGDNNFAILAPGSATATASGSLGSWTSGTYTVYCAAMNGVAANAGTFSLDTPANGLVLGFGQTDVTGKLYVPFSNSCKWCYGLCLVRWCICW